MKKPVSLLCPLFAAAALFFAAALPASAAPEPPGPGGVSDSALITVIASVGDDVFSTTDVTSLLDPTGATTQHYGPYASGSPDSGTCGNDWAEDTFNRVFTVHTNPDGTFTVVEQFKDGSFVTNNGPSPGACETNIGGTLTMPHNGSMHGYFVIPLPAGEIQTSTDQNCVAQQPNTPCTTTGFIDSHFTPCYFGGTGTCPVTTFFFHYSAGDQSLLFHEWKNASMDRGGDNGDIADT
jgi:hypothetical protein